MAKFTVRLSGNAPVWADVEVEADSAEEALEKAHNDDFDPAHEADWAFCEGGNGVDDWTTTGDVYDAEGNALMEDGEALLEEDADDKEDDEDEEGD